MKKSIPQQFDIFLDAIQAMIMSFLIKLGPFFVALMPALFTAVSIYRMLVVEAGQTLALIISVTVGLGMETVGIVAIHTAIDLFDAKEQGTINPAKFKLMVWLVPLYVAGVSLVVGFSGDAFPPLVKGLGIASPFLTCIVYVAVALARNLSRIEKQGQDKEDTVKADIDQGRDWQHEQDRRLMEMKHEERMAKIASNNRPTTVQQPSSLDAQHRPMETPNAVRWASKEAKLDATLDFLRRRPDASFADIGNHIGLSKSSGENYAKALEGAGKVQRNGSGWEVV